MRLIVFLAIIAITQASTTTKRSNQVIPVNATEIPEGLQQIVETLDLDDFVPYKSDRHDTFDWTLLKDVLAKSNSNVIFSPFSVKLILALLNEGAGFPSQTQKELSIILPDIKAAPLTREYFGNILSSLKEKSQHYQLNFGTKIYVDSFIEPIQRYAGKAQKFYDADIEQVDFLKSEQTKNHINSWCANVTEGHINNLVSQGDIENSVMLMLNAIYFEGLWKRPFADSNTFEFPFYLKSNKDVKATYMQQTEYFFYYDSKDLDAKMLRMRYKGQKFAMTFILPNSNTDGLDSIVDKMDSNCFKQLQWSMDYKQVKVTLPKFHFEYTSQLKEILQSLGIEEIFTENASLPGLVRGQGLNRQLKVTDIIQKAGLIIDENGSKAYAVTEATLENKFGGGNDYDEFNANRPFLFFIEDETTGTILFAGKVLDPTKP